jgi:glucose/arabinose dehydrogenase
MGRLSALVAVVALVISACSSDTDAGGDAETVPTTAPSTAPLGTTTPSTSSSVDSAPAITTVDEASGADPVPELAGVALETVAQGLSKPVFVTGPPNDHRVFIVQHVGVIRMAADGELASEPFLDIKGDVDSGGNEQGLLGMAFHPGYADNGRFFVYLTNNGGDTEVLEYRVSDDPNRADAGSQRELLEVAQPASNHNGGMLEFGPDGYLYVGLGDGGAADDQFGNGQRPDTLLGTILRLDVDSSEPYAIPPDNPFVDGGGAREVWAYGLRNPWRFSIDAPTNTLYIADVGQNRFEEIDVVDVGLSGLNFGWPAAEGNDCRAGDCSGFVAPVLTYDHGQGCSVTGGYVYRGEAIPELDGHYFYADWCGGWVKSFRFDGSVSDETDWSSELGAIGAITSFGTDAAGELYITTGEGSIFKLIPVR